MVAHVVGDATNRRQDEVNVIKRGVEVSLGISPAWKVLVPHQVFTSGAYLLPVLRCSRATFPQRGVHHLQLPHLVYCHISYVLAIQLMHTAP